MPISSSSLFHFTNSVEKFRNILVNGFRVNISIESHSTFSGTNKWAKYALAIPMVCFCDIPLSVAQKHVNIYGGKRPFGLGLSRAWGVKNCAPVIYSDTRGPFRASTGAASLAFEHLLETKALSEFNESAYRRDFVEIYTTYKNETQTHQILKTELLFKPIIGDYNYGGSFKSTSPKYINHSFYDEREWRYIPNPINRLPYYDQFAFWKYQVNFTQEERIPNFSKKYQQEFHSNKRKLYNIFSNLTFSSEDIEYLIVDTDETLKETVAWLVSTSENITIGGSEIIEKDEIYLLISKLISYEGIRKNFSLN